MPVSTMYIAIPTAQYNDLSFETNLMAVPIVKAARISVLFAATRNLSCLVGKPIMWLPNRSDTNRPVQAQKRARSLKFGI